MERLLRVINSLVDDVELVELEPVGIQSLEVPDSCLSHQDRKDPRQELRQALHLTMTSKQEKGDLADFWHILLNLSKKKKRSRRGGGLTQATARIFRVEVMSTRMNPSQSRATRTP